MRCTSARRLVTNSPDRKFCTPVAASGIEHSTSVHVKTISRFLVMTSVPISQKNMTAFRKCSVSSVTLPPGQYDRGNREDRPGDQREADAHLRRKRRDGPALHGRVEHVGDERDGRRQKGDAQALEHGKPFLRREQQDGRERDEGLEREVGVRDSRGRRRRDRLRTPPVLGKFGRQHQTPPVSCRSSGSGRRRSRRREIRFRGTIGKFRDRDI